MPSVTVAFRHFLILASLLLLSMPASLRGEMRTGVLPDDYADFAMHPETGTVAAVSPDSNEVALFRNEDLLRGSAAPAAKIDVGSTPCSVFYKRFQKTEVFAVVCSQDQHMFLIHAGPSTGDRKEFSLLKKIELKQLGVSLVTGSVNPEDPFVYYCYGAGHGSATGVVSLRDLENHGPAFDDSMDCAISASGELAYRRGPWSPSGFESLILINSLQDETPKFTKLFYDHKSVAPYVPGPFDRYVASGNRVFSRTLQDGIASLNFVPECFLRSAPVILGMKAEDPRNRIRRTGAAPPDVVIQAASYNTFTDIGKPVTIRRQLPEGDRALERGIPGSADFKRLRKRHRLFADEQRNRVIFAEGNRLYSIPLADFELPDEPLLTVALDGSRTFTVSEPGRLRIQPRDDRIKVTAGGLPEGMKLSNNELVWTPTQDQLGTTEVELKLSAGALERTEHFPLTVAYPRHKLPFAPSGFALSADGARAVIWSGTVSRSPQPRNLVRQQEDVELAVVDLQTMKTSSTAELDRKSEQVLLAGGKLILLNSATPTMCEVRDLNDLSKTRRVSQSSPINNARVVGKYLILQFARGLQVLETDDLKAIAEIRSTDLRTPPPVSEDGILEDGVLWDFDGTPKLLTARTGLASLGGPVALERNRFGPPAPTQQQQLLNDQYRYYSSPLLTVRAATEQVPGVQRQVSIDARRAYNRNSSGGLPFQNNAYHLFEFSLTFAGDIDRKIDFFRETRLGNIRPEDVPALPLLQVSREDAFVIQDDHLYRFPMPKPASSGSAAAEPLTWPKKQAAFALSAGKTTTLKHEVQGGRPPLQFALSRRLDGVSIDSRTGTVTIANDLLLKSATAELEAFLTRGYPRSTPYPDRLQKYISLCKEKTNKIVEEPSTGPAVLVPIQVAVRDSGGATESIRYSLLAEVPAKEIEQRLAALETEREEQMASARRNPAGQPDISQTKDEEIATLKRKVESLEQRLDLVTRQLNQILEKLDKQNRE